MSLPMTPGLCFTLVEDVRAGALAVFQGYAEALQDPGLDGPLLWLVFNVFASKANMSDLLEAAAFVGDPEALITRVVEGGYVVFDGAHYQITPKALGLVEKLSAHSQEANRQWRREITEVTSVETLDQALLTLWGNVKAAEA